MKEKELQLLQISNKLYVISKPFQGRQKATL